MKIIYNLIDHKTRAKTLTLKCPRKTLACHDLAFEQSRTQRGGVHDGSSLQYLTMLTYDFKNCIFFTKTRKPHYRYYRDIIRTAKMLHICFANIT